MPDWSEWEKAIDTKLNQLNHMGTWELVDPLAEAIPIANKWVLLKKFNKEGILVKYKARLVAKGCAQRPGYDFMETFSPVVCLKMIRAILALIPGKNLKVQQIDVKGAYLNGLLSERVYMKQLEGYDDGTGCVCCLIKTLYGLKQAGREWNQMLDQCLKGINFNNFFLILALMYNATNQEERILKLLLFG